MCRSSRAARAPVWPAARCRPKAASFCRCRDCDRILKIDLENRLAIVEPGVINLDVTKAVAKDGFFYAPDPSSQAACSIGGNVANNSGGPHTLAYGVTTNHVVGIEVVLDDGEIVWLGGEVPDTPGYDLCGVFVGSEGTMGIVTKIAVKLMPIRESVRTLLAIFDDMDFATKTVVDITAAGIIPAALEIMDHTAIEAVERGAPVGFPRDAAAVLIVEVEGLERAYRAVDTACQSKFANATAPAKCASPRMKSNGSCYGKVAKAPSAPWALWRRTITSKTASCRAASYPR